MLACLLVLPLLPARLGHTFPGSCVCNSGSQDGEHVCRQTTEVLQSQHPDNKLDGLKCREVKTVGSLQEKKSLFVKKLSAFKQQETPMTCSHETADIIFKQHLNQIYFNDILPSIPASSKCFIIFRQFYKNPLLFPSSYTLRPLKLPLLNHNIG